MLYFLAAVYNEEREIEGLLHHVYPLVDGYAICDDGSYDLTTDTLDTWYLHVDKPFKYEVLEHTGLPETVKNEALKLIPDGSWVLMLDADERLHKDTVKAITNFFHSGEDKNWDYVYFNQWEIINEVHVRTFQKCKLFRKESVRFPLNNIHADDQFEGRGTYFGWVVLHRKTSAKQYLRETEYLQTYKKLLDEGSIDEGRYQWLRNLHHYVK